MPALITFGDGSWRFRSASKRLARHALRTGIVDTCSRFTLQDVFQFPCTTAEDIEFIESNPSPGLGCWLWKPLLLHHAVCSAQDGDEILYLDAGFELNLRNEESLARLDDYWALARDQGLAALTSGTSTQEYTKSLVMDSMQLQPFADSAQVASGAVFVSVNTTSRRFVLDWLEWSRSRKYSLLDNELTERESTSFVAPRWEQAIFSGLYHQYSLNIINDPAHFGHGYWKWHESGKVFPLWASRNITGIPRYAWPSSLAVLGLVRIGAERIWHSFQK